MQSVIALIGLKAAFCDVHADDGVGRNPEHFQAFEVRRHVRLADQHIAYADLLEMVAQCRLADAQWPAAPVRAMRTHIAAGIERHPRGATDWRLHIGVGKAHAPLCHGVDIGRLQGRMPRTPQIVEAKLVAHDPENVFGSGHVRYFGDFRRLMVLYCRANNNR
jgi:hypothetical protein